MNELFNGNAVSRLCYLWVMSTASWDWNPLEKYWWEWTTLECRIICILSSKCPYACHDVSRRNDIKSFHGNSSKYAHIYEQICAGYAFLYILATKTCSFLRVQQSESVKSVLAYFISFLFWFQWKILYFQTVLVLLSMLREQCSAQIAGRLREDNGYMLVAVCYNRSLCGMLSQILMDIVEHDPLW